MSWDDCTPPVYDEKGSLLGATVRGYSRSYGNFDFPAEFYSAMDLGQKHDFYDVRINVAYAWWNEDTRRWEASFEVYASRGLARVVESAEEAKELRRALRIIEGRDPDTGALR